MAEMIDNTGDWCYEGGCTYLTTDDTLAANEKDDDELDALYGEPCEASYD